MEMFRNRLAGGVPGIVERCTFWGEPLDCQVCVGAEGAVRSRPTVRHLPPALFKTLVVPRGCCQLEAWFTRRPDLIAQSAAMRIFGDCAWPFCVFEIILAGSGHDLPLQRQRRGVKKILTGIPLTDCKPAARKFGCVLQKNDTVTGVCQKFFLYLEFI